MRCMLKKILFIFIGFFLIFSWFVFANEQPWINCAWLPWCKSDDITNTQKVPSNVGDFTETFALKIAVLIQYVAVLAVISVMLWGIFYMLSWGEEEKLKKAKTWIIWSLVWVFASVSAWFIINLINEIQIY